MPIASIGIRHILIKYGLEDSELYTYCLYIPYLLTGSFICINKWYEKIYQIYNKIGVFRIPVICMCLIAMILIRQLSGKGLVFDSWVATVLVFCFACMFIFRIVEKIGLVHLFKNDLLSYIFASIIVLAGVILFAFVYQLIEKKVKELYSRHKKSKEEIKATQ